MKSFIEWFKEKYNCPPSGMRDEPLAWAMERLADGVVEYIEDVVQSSRDTE